MTAEDADLIARATAWIDQDPDPVTASELALLVDRVRDGDEEARREVSDRFSGHLTFGTAGLRGELGAGPMRMNRVVVAHAAHGLGNFLLDRAKRGEPLSVAIGWDARHNSDIFARDTAEILSGLGIRALLFDSPTPTPVLAFSVRHLDTTAGVMVTASHNPPSDNGYKVYLGGADGGSQIIPPADAGIHEHIMASHRSGPVTALPRAPEAIVTMGDEVTTAYIDATARVLEASPAENRTALRVCYTPLHGVGADVFLRLLRQAGFSDPVVVPEQAAPDPLFPTVAFPNPEEPGALDLSYRTATAHHCDLIVAHDPDADRLAVAVPDSASPSGWAMVSGNDLGVLLLADSAEGAAAVGRTGALASSLVSTPMIARLAEKNGLRFVSTPTGFKWISRPPDLLAGFEEALGYLVNPDTVRDKDGMSAGLALVNLAHRLHQKHMTLTDRLAEIATHYGGWASETISIRLASIDDVDRLMDGIRRSPETLFGSDEVSTTDYRVNPPAGFPATNLLAAHDDTGGRMIIRPSGTEPKIKLYLDVVTDDAATSRDHMNRMAGVYRARLAALIGPGTGV